MHHQQHGYFGLLDIENVENEVLPNSLIVSALTNLAGSSQEVNKLYYRMSSDMIAKSIEGLITKKYFKKLRLHRG